MQAAEGCLKSLLFPSACLPHHPLFSLIAHPCALYVSSPFCAYSPPLFPPPPGFYIAPEVLQQKAYDTSVDVFSFGIILYEV